MKRFVRDSILRLGGFLLRLFSPFWVALFRLIARTGVGTDICLKHGFLPLPVHFFSPVPDIEDLRRRGVWSRRSELRGIDFRVDRQLQFLRKLGAAAGEECRWPPDPQEDPYAFHTENQSFSFGCAACLYSILRLYRPRRIIEIGSGNSSLVISSAVMRNASRPRPDRYVIIDPYPSKKIETGLPGLSRLIKERVEMLDPSFFDSLGKDDVLFIDSGHTVRTGGDVNYLFLDVLPRLSRGVLVHIHDIPMPFEYPEIYFTNPSFRMFWTESYLLQAFLCFNNKYEILLAMSYLMTEKREEFRKAFPYYNPVHHKANSGSFWIRRKIR
jgi:hypothetical protein